MVIVNDHSAIDTVRHQVDMLRSISSIRRVGLLVAPQSTLALDGSLSSIARDITIFEFWSAELSLGIVGDSCTPEERRVLVCHSEHKLSKEAMAGYLAYHVATGGASAFTPGIFETWRVAPLAQAWDREHLPSPPEPPVERPLGSIAPELGFAYVAHAPRELSSHHHPSPATICEDGVPLGPRNAPHAEIRDLGRGRYSFWYDFVYFSASDNSDPRTNGRRYTMQYPSSVVVPAETSRGLLSRVATGVRQAMFGSDRTMTAAQEPAAVVPAGAEEKPAFFLGSERDQIEMLVDRVTEFYPFPRVVNLVLTNLCNLKCVMCPYHSPAYPDQSGYMSTRRYMTEETFLQVAREAAAHGAWLKMGQLEEVFMHPKLLTFIRRAHELGVPHMHVTTNGTLLNTERSTALLTSGLTQINVSVDAVTAETYKKVRGWNLDKLVKNVEELLAIRTATGSQTQVFIAMILQDEAVDEEAEFIRFWRERGADGVVVYQLSEHHHGENYFKGKYFAHTPPTERHACQSVWQEVYVYPEGEVSTCCTTLILVPQKGLISMGNVNQDTLESIWAGHEYSGLRRRLLTNDIEHDVACKDCDIWASCEQRFERRDGYLLEMNPTMATHYFRR